MEPIAIIGIGCRFPGGVSSPDDLWTLLVEGRDVVGALPAERIEQFRSMPGFASIPPFGGFLDDVWDFDPAFFGVSPREAAAMDPQHRLLLQTTLEALEDAGIRPSSLSATNTGVFVGLFANDYAIQNERSDMLGHLGSSRHASAGRIAYTWNLLGPSLVVDTDRSSGLVALQAACTSLRGGECDTAIVGAANVIVDAATGIAFARAGMLARDGRSKFADVSADGFVRSEGVATLVLRPLSLALADGNPIYAVIRGGAVAASGNLAGDLMAQSPDAQERLLRAALRSASIDASEVAYVEAHGTGTPAGDRAELEALSRVFGSVERAAPCLVGSIKTNIGHCEPCSGLAGLIKAALVVRQREIPRTLHCSKPLPSSLRIAVEAVRLARDATVIAGVSSFGLSGINAHVILESPPATPPPSAGERARPRASILCLSAASEGSLRDLARAHAEALQGGADLADACRSAALHRDHLAYRAAFVVEDREHARRDLLAFADRTAPDSAFVQGRARVREPDAPIVFVYPGHGSQWAGMGIGLLEKSAVFADKMRECDVLFRKIASRSLLEELRDPSQFERVEIVQPLLVAIQISLSALLASWGVKPTAVVGASMGEVVAAHVAGAITLEEALVVTHVRTSLMKTVSGGAMAVVELPVDAVVPRLDPRKVSIGAIHSATSTVISGERASVEALVHAFEAENVFARLVRFNVASHSPQMDPILADLRRGLATLAPRESSISFFSTVRGRIVDGAELNADYWVDNLRLPVDLASATRTLGTAPSAVFVEVSPHPVLRSPILDGVVQGGPAAPLVTFTLERDADELLSVLRTGARLHVFGVPVAWDQITAGGRFARLPRYPWANAAYKPQPRTASPTTPRPLPSPSSSAPSSIVEPMSFAETLRSSPAASRSRLLVEELRREAARLLGLALDEIDVDRPLREHGLGSAAATELRATIGGWLGRSYPSALLFNHPTIRALASHLADGDTGDAPQPAVAPSIVEGKSTMALAIVGAALRFPRGISSREAFWRFLLEGGDAITEIPPDRWDAARFYDPDVRAKGKMHTKWGGFVEDVARFDAELFGISPKEAESMDPQQRMLLELSWEALEDAGLSRSAVMGKPIGVFVGIMNNNEYARRKGVDQHPEDVVPHTSTGDAASIAAGRISYAFGLHGPAVSIDTACSSSLVALHLAAQSIRLGETSAAIVAGVNVIAHPTTTLSFAKTRMLSPTGRCKTFDARADGYVRSEGGCVVILKPLADALAAGDEILAILSGSAVNQDGRGSGLTAPNGAAQEALVRAALANAGVSAEDVSYVETHGTGTPLGDPIEVDSLVRVFEEGRTPSNPLVLGAVKANVGHLEACAGLAGVMKVALAMQARTIPLQPHFEQPNPKLRLPEWLRIPRTNLRWEPQQKRWLAGVSSFGFSGTNAHVILEAPPERSDPPSAALPNAVFCVSGTSDEALRERATGILASDALASADLVALAASAARREHLGVRAAAVARSLPELREQLRAIADGRRVTGVYGPSPAIESPAIAFVYGRMSDFDPSAARDLFQAVPAFRDAIHRCGKALGEMAGARLEDLVARASPELTSMRLRRIAAFAMQVGVTEAWRAWGVAPEHVAGDGVGEIAAAHTAGIIGEADALAFLAEASELRDHDLDALSARLVLRPPRTTFTSGAAGAARIDAPRDPAWWRCVVQETAPKVDLVEALASAGANVIVDVGTASASESPRSLCVPSLLCGDALARTAEALARVYAAGLTVAWERFYGAHAGRRHRLPPYPFKRRRYWSDFR